MVCAIRLAKETQSKKLIANFRTRTVTNPQTVLSPWTIQEVCLHVRAHALDFDASVFQTLRDLWLQQTRLRTALLSSAWLRNLKLIIV